MIRNPFKGAKRIVVPPGAMLKPQDRADQVSEADKKRFKEIAIEVLEILVKHNVTLMELPRVTQTILAIINKKIDGADLETIIREL